MERMIQGAGFLSTNSCRVVDVTEDTGKAPIDFKQERSGECCLLRDYLGMVWRTVGQPVETTLS